MTFPQRGVRTSREQRKADERSGSPDERRAFWHALALTALLLAPLAPVCAADETAADVRVPILAYHRFGPVVADTMTVTTRTFVSHLEYLAEHGYTVIPLRRLVDARRGAAPPPPPRAVVITADDAHRSVYEEMYPLVRRFAVPVTLFVYPSAVSNADYALTWDQLRELRDSGLFDIQSHTYWHPNFRREKARLSPDAYEQLVATQLERSRDRLARELGARIDLLAWPFGIHDAELAALAARAGYVAAVTLDARPSTPADDLMALPRYLMTEQVRGAAFARLVAAGEDPHAAAR
jgi:peptidoglycan/xylan/chitin deacetylase (PgdA/CDA1 family)